MTLELRRDMSAIDPFQVSHTEKIPCWTCNTVARGLTENWHVWLLSGVLVVAAVIDGWKLKVPNWITFPLIVSGWVYGTACFGWEGLGWSLVGTALGLGLLLPAYAIGGMGAGDVKLLAGVGAWVWATVTLYAFCVSAIFGGIIAVAMVLLRDRLAPSRPPILGHPQRNRRRSRSQRPVGHRRRAEEFHDAVALRDSHRLGHNYLFCLERDASVRGGGRGMEWMEVAVRRAVPNSDPNSELQRSRLRS